MASSDQSTLPPIGPCAVCCREIEYGESYRMGRDGQRRHAACEDEQARHEPTRRAADPRPNCGDCGRFIGSGASMAMRYSGYPPTPDHEDFRCAPCGERLGPMTEDKP